MASPDDGYLCTMNERGFLKSWVELFDFFNGKSCLVGSSLIYSFSDVALQNLETPISEVVNVYNGLVHGLPFIPDAIDEIKTEDLENFFNSAHGVFDAISSSTKELDVMTFVFKSQ